APRDVPSVVEEYVAACRERNILALRFIHGKGRGVQRAVVRRVLRSLEAVASFGDAPAERGGFGATVVSLHPCVATRAPANSSSISEAAHKPRGTGVSAGGARAPASLLAKR